MDPLTAGWNLALLIETVSVAASVIAAISAWAACLSLLAGNNLDDVGRAVNLGIAIGFVPGVICGLVVAYDGAGSSVSTLFGL